MRVFQMDHGWYFSVPDNWTAERDSQDGHYLFYPSDSDLTLHFTPWRVEKEGSPPRRNGCWGLSSGGYRRTLQA